MTMAESLPSLSRRALVAGLAGLGGLVITGCSRSPEPGQAQVDALADSQAAPQRASMTVYRDPSCGCCKAWAEIAGEAGYRVSVVDRPDMSAIKRKLGVPEELASCHTTVVGGYVIEGHVPLAEVRRLLAARPAGIKGIAVPGMPRGSPGMEMPDGSTDPFEVMAFGRDGEVSVFRA